MRLYSWNVNGFRALCTRDSWAWFKDVNADVVGLQETKADLAQIPEEHREPIGYHSAWFSSAKKRGYSGVATFSRV